MSGLSVQHILRLEIPFLRNPSKGVMLLHVLLWALISRVVQFNIFWSNGSNTILLPITQIQQEEATLGISRDFDFALTKAVIGLPFLDALMGGYRSAADCDPLSW